jgi:hypothetical protein
VENAIRISDYSDGQIKINSKDKIMKKTKFEKMLAIFDETHKICNWENTLKWREELEKHNWTDEEFDEELYKRMDARRTA